MTYDDFPTIAPQLVANGYRPVPIKPGSKRPPMDAWQNFHYDPNDNLNHFQGFGTGLILGHVVAPDIDVMCPECANELHQLAETMLGHAPPRIGMAPKVLLIYRTSVLFKKKYTKKYEIEGYGDGNRVEILADGQQCVAYAIHPGTKQPYVWPNSHPLEVPFAELVEITEQQVTDFIAEAENVLARYGTPVAGQGGNGATDGLNVGGEAGDLDEMIEAARTGATGMNDARIRLMGRLARDGYPDAVVEAIICSLHVDRYVHGDGRVTVYTLEDTRAECWRMFRDCQEKDRRRAEEQAGEGIEPEPKKETPRPDVNLPTTFWGTRPVLTQIRDYAWSNMVSPDALLGYIMARIAAFVPHGTQMFSKKKGSGLNLFSAVIGVPGAGKTELGKLARILVPARLFQIIGGEQDKSVDGATAGTGEGLLKLYLEWEKDEGWVQVRNNAFIVIDEGSIIEDIKNRTGSTLSSIMRTAFTGEKLGTANASKETIREVNDYCMGIAINLQPEAAQSLLSEDKYGTPQRFLWWSATDPAIPETMPFIDDFRIDLPVASQHITFHSAIRAEINRTLWLRASGQEIAVEIDAHIGWIRCKVAAIFALLDSRREVNDDDWSLAGCVIDTSCRVRDNLLDTIRKHKLAEKEERLAERIADNISLKAAPTRVETFAKRVARFLHAKGPYTEGQLRKRAFKSVERELFPAALKLAEYNAWVVEDPPGTWRAGPVKP